MGSVTANSDFYATTFGMKISKILLFCVCVCVANLILYIHTYDLIHNIKSNK